MKKDLSTYSISISFESASLPPFKDILILAKKCSHGMNGLSKCMQLLSPDNFELINIDNNKVEAIVVSKKILSRMPQEKLIAVLHEKVFPFITEGEIVKVDFHIKITLDEFQITVE